MLAETVDSLTVDCREIQTQRSEVLLHDIWNDVVVVRDGVEGSGTLLSKQYLSITDAAALRCPQASEANERE